MIAAFIDESEKGELFYFLGALVITQEDYFGLRDSLKSLQEEVTQKHPHISPEFEFHAWEIMNGIDHWQTVPIRYRIYVMSRVLKAVAASSGCLHLEGIDREKHKAMKYKDTYPAREVAFTYLLEKVNWCTTSRAPIDDVRYLVQVFADEHHTKKESTTNFTEYQAYGTWGYKQSKLENLMPTIEFKDSRETYALQAIDCVTYIFNRVMTHVETDVRAEKAKAMLWAIVQPMFRGCSTTRIWPA